MSDGAQIVLFVLGLVAVVALVVGPLMFFSRKSKRKGRGYSSGSTSVSDTMNDINNAL